MAPYSIFFGDNTYFDEESPWEYGLIGLVILILLIVAVLACCKSEATHVRDVLITKTVVTSCSNSTNSNGLYSTGGLEINSLCVNCCAALERTPLLLSSASSSRTTSSERTPLTTSSSSSRTYSSVRTSRWQTSDNEIVCRFYSNVFVSSLQQFCIDVYKGFNSTIIKCHNKIVVYQQCCFNFFNLITQT